MPLQQVLRQKRPVNHLRFPSAALGENPDNLYSLIAPPTGDRRRRVNTDGAIQGSRTVRPGRGAMTSLGGVKSKASIGFPAGSKSRIA